MNSTAASPVAAKRSRSFGTKRVLLLVFGTITVLAPASSSASDAQSAPASSPVNEPFAQDIAFVAALIAIGGAVRLGQLVRTQRRTTAAA